MPHASVISPRAETVVPRRLVSAGAPGFTALVGGLPRGAVSSVPGLVGCVRGLKVGGDAVPMAETAQAFPGESSVRLRIRFIRAGRVVRCVLCVHVS